MGLTTEDKEGAGNCEAPLKARTVLSKIKLWLSSTIRQEDREGRGGGTALFKRHSPCPFFEPSQARKGPRALQLSNVTATAHSLTRPTAHVSVAGSIANL